MGGRYKLAVAAQYADPLVAYLKQAPGVRRVTVAGSYRRAKETVGDLDIVVTAPRESPVIERFVAYSEVAEVTAKGSTRASVRLACGLQVDLRVVREESYGAAPAPCISCGSCSDVRSERAYHSYPTLWRKDA
jgi:DNA polymerase (family 10)